jgi:hypothetical protein
MKNVPATAAVMRVARVAWQGLLSTRVKDLGMEGKHFS